MDKIERIKAEIERLRKLLPWGGSASQLAMECNCKNEAYDEILAFIDSLQEIEGTSSKSPMIPQDKDSLHIEETCKENEDSFTYSLEEACIKIQEGLYDGEYSGHIEGYQKAARMGAEWMREQMMKEAVEGVIIDEDMYGNKICLYKIPKGSKYKNAESVKILILKDNDTQGNA